MSATALARQLQKISEASTNTLNRRKLKLLHSTSLIFEPAHAATQDLDTIYSIALEGFNELCLLDQRFYAFERGLFSQSSKDVDRFLLTKDEVKELDSSIEAFLEIVSGRLLLKPAMKATEWLVRRFRIHDQNTTALILAFLPYHGHTTLFPTLLSIIDPKDVSSELKFLRPYLKPAAPVPRHVVTHSLSHRRETLDLLISHVVSVVKAHRESHQLLAFFSTVTVEAISMMCDAARSATTTGITEESVLQKILPLLEETYRASKIPEFQVGGYMVTTVVVSKIPMNDKVLLALMNGIVSGWSSESISPGLACLALIAQARTGESPGQLPDNVTKKMLALNDIVGRLEQMGDKYRVDNLVVGFAHGILENVGKPYGSREVVYVIRLLERLKLGSKSRKSMLSGLLNLAQNLQGFGEDLEEEGIVRDLLATSLLRWSEQGSTKVGKLLELVFEENKVDVEMLELALRTIIRRPEIQEATAENQEEIETPPQPSTDSMGLEALLANLPESSATVSFLAPEVPALFEQLQQLFLVAMRRSNGVEQLLACSIFVNSKSEAFTISFLARIWTSASNPIVARAAALNQVAKIIKVNAKDGVDYQALIPLSIVSLMDPADQVRRQAAELITRLTKNYKQSEEPEAGSESGKKRKRRGGADSLTYWGLETLYGSGIETSQLKVLDASDAQKFLTIVMGGGLQECVLDPTYVAKVLESGLGSSRDKQKEGRLRSNTKTNILSFLSSHAVNVPSVSIKLRLLSILNQISKAHVSRTQFLLPALQQWVQGSFEQHRKACEQERIHIHHLEEQLVNVVGEGEKADAVITLTAILDKNLGGKGLISTSAKHIINIYNSLDNSLKVSTAKDLLEIRLRDNSEREDLGSSEAIGILRKVRLPTEAFQAWLDNARAALRSALGLDARAQAKRRRTSLTRDSPLCKDDRVVNAILRITVVTELLENQKPQNHSSTLSKLFGVLGDLGSVEYSGITYLQSVLLSCAREIISGYKTTNTNFKTADVVRADVLVSCIRSTTSPQVQNSALLLLSSLADIAPDTVRHSVMPIFTFMGANTLRQDDEYSAHVIEQTVQRVIPTVVKSLQGQGTGLLASGAELVSTFVASYRHVPVHRRLKLFEALTEALGPTEFLFTVVAKLAGMYAVDEGDVEVGEFVSMLAGGFPAEAQLKSVVHYLSTVKDVLNPQPAGLASILFGLEENGRDVPMEEMARRLLSVLKSFLSSERLKAKIQKSLKSSKEAAVSLRSSFSEAMEQIMALGQQYATHKTISTEILDTMSRLLELLTIVEFVRVIEGLISRPDSSFQSLALTTFKNRVAAEYRTDTASRTAILALSPKIAHIVTASEAADELKADALLCIQAVIKIFGKQEPNTIFALSDILVGPGALHCVDNGLRVLALVCLTNMASVLGGRIVPVLPKTVPVAVEYLRMAINGEDNMSSLEIVLMHNAVFKYLEELVNILPSFMTSYLKNVLLLAGAAWEREDLDEDVQCDVRRGFLNVITAKIELKTVVAVSNKVWKATCETGEASAVRDLIEMVQKAISNATKSVVQRSHQPLLQFFISALDLRCGGLIMVEEDVDSLEDTVMAVCLEIVYKLNDSIFKPMFLRLVEWATEDVFLAGKNEGSEVEDGKWTRLGVVWKLLETLSENLKSLVTDYYTPLLPTAHTLLSSTATTATTPGPSRVFATTHILRAIHLGLVNDVSDYFHSPTHFLPLLTTILSLLSHPATTTTSKSKSTDDSENDEDITIRVIAELAAHAILSEDHAKALNSGLSTLMRDHESAHVRLSAVKALVAVYARVGDEWLGLLPETVPFIAEVLEDEDEIVEREGQRLVAKIEEFLGVGELQGMLT